MIACVRFIRCIVSSSATQVTLVVECLNIVGQRKKEKERDRECIVLVLYLYIHRVYRA